MALQPQETDEQDEQDDSQQDKKGKKDKKKREQQTLSQVLTSINKKYGAGSLIQGRGAMVPVEVWSTGLASLDQALGCGGIPKGRIIELFGLESSGKTTTTLMLAGTCQNTKFKTAEGGTRNGVVAFIDAEHAFDPQWATKVGVDVEQLIFSQPDSGEEALNIVSDLVDTGQVDLIVVDSVAALTPQVELDGEIGDHNIGAQARMMSAAMRMLKGKCSNTGCSVVFINQIREKIGVMFGSPNTTPGGKALKFYASIRMEIRAGQPIDVSKKRIGRVTNISVIKNKVGPPFTKTEFDLMYGAGGVYGPNKVKSLVLAACGFKLIERVSSYYHVLGKKWNGFDAFCEAVAADPAIYDHIAAKFKEAVEAKRAAITASAVAADEMYDEELLEALEDDD